MTSRSLPLLAILFFTACSSSSSSRGNEGAGLHGDGGETDGGSDSPSTSTFDASPPFTFSACLLGGTSVHSIVLVATSPSVCAQVAAYTVVDPSQPPASSTNLEVTTTPSDWAFRGAFAGANAGSCDVGNHYPPATDVRGTIAVDPTDASTISANVVIGYVDGDGPKTLTLTANDVAVAPSCP